MENLKRGSTVPGATIFLRINEFKPTLWLCSRYVGQVASCFEVGMYILVHEYKYKYID
jgi:hypothetical protein